MKTNKCLIELLVIYSNTWKNLCALIKLLVLHRNTWNYLSMWHKINGYQKEQTVYIQGQINKIRNSVEERQLTGIDDSKLSELNKESFKS